MFFKVLFYVEACKRVGLSLLLKTLLGSLQDIIAYRTKGTVETASAAAADDDDDDDEEEDDDDDDDDE